MSPGVNQHAEHEYDKRFTPIIDSSILFIFRYFCPRVSEDMPTWVLQCAERECGWMNEGHQGDHELNEHYERIRWISKLPWLAFNCREEKTPERRHTV
ncbi:hypothetical protein Y032_0559g3455 [Ancylostoma ceylanicum]|uniref:Uncharacterized protein n=1 Tax=Ancylostoma ceylanicum TaxID=53326 RepID=A0A016WQ46_9BILA|nr:hypothetical protein Y032_0559g3455 [Ancylostoma ceylanicum]